MAWSSTGAFAMPYTSVRVRGFTLIELLMGIAILAVMLTLAAPSYGKLVGRTHGRTAHNEIDTALNLARLTAVSHVKRVVMCPSSDGQQCAATTQWQHGWLVFADLDHDGTHSADEPVIRVAQGQPAGVAILSTVGRQRVTYQPDGSASGSNVTLTICDRVAGAENATSLVINQAGRVRSAKATPSATTACLAVAG
jgi:type IV fimbrial biogenesis protein FimT